MTAQRIVVVAGASGIVGRAVLDLARATAGVDAIGLSRRPPDLADGPEHVALDLTDADSVRAAAPRLARATHLVFAALHEQPGLIRGWREEAQMRTNLAMLSTLGETLERHAPRLEHVTLLQGTKAYGVHLGRMTVPGRERAPRDQHANFYWLQEDWLRAAARRTGWRFTILRPQVVIGHALGAPMNLLAAIGLYAALQRARGEPLDWPGGPAYALECTCADLLARAILWAGTAETARDRTFNVTNGEAIAWPHLWPALAQMLGAEPGQERPQRLAEALPVREAEWSAIVRRHGLRDLSLRETAGDSFIYADFNFATGHTAPPPAALVSTVAIREAGFADCLDSEHMFAAWFERLRTLRILPPL